MDRAKLTSFLLLVASLGALLFVICLALGPYLLVRIGEDSGGLPPGCLAVAVIVLLVPVAGAPGVAGAAIWWRSVRPRTSARRREVASWPDQETALQQGFDRLALVCLDGEGEESFRSLDRAADQLSSPHRDRWRRFLALSEAAGSLSCATGPPAKEESAAVSARGLRSLAFVVTLLGVFCLFWALLVAVQQLFTRGSQVAYGIAPGPETAWIGASGCLIPGITLVTGGFGLAWLLRGEARRRAGEVEWRHLACESLLTGCVRRIELLAGHGLATLPAAAAIHRLARASVIDALAEVGGDQKGHLLATLHARGLTLNLFHGSDLKEARLREADLSGVSLRGADLSHSVLAGARIEKADLRDCRFASADLRQVAAAGADFQHCDLRHTRLHQSDLRQADFRTADMLGANLWSADLSGADLRDCVVSREQLAAASSLAGASLPLEMGGRA